MYGTSQAIVRTLKARAHGPVWTDLGVVKFGRLIQDGGGVGVRGSWYMPVIPAFYQQMQEDQEFKVLVVCMGILRPAWAIGVLSQNKTNNREKGKKKSPRHQE